MHCSRCWTSCRSCWCCCCRHRCCPTRRAAESDRRGACAARSTECRRRDRRPARRRTDNSGRPTGRAASGTCHCRDRTGRPARFAAAADRRPDFCACAGVAASARSGGSTAARLLPGFAAAVLALAPSAPSRNRKIIPSTAERDTPSSSAAISTAVLPSAHSRCNAPIRSVVHSRLRIALSPRLCPCQTSPECHIIRDIGDVKSPF